MSQRSRQREAAREQKQERLAKRVVNGIFIALILLGLLFIIGFCIYSN